MEGRPTEFRGRFARVVRPVLVILLLFGGVSVAVLSSPNRAAADTVVSGCTIVSSPTPTHYTKCPGANLAGTDLTPYDLSYADLVGANLSGSTLANCPLQGESNPCFATNFTDAKLTDANLSDSTLANCAPEQIALGGIPCSSANFTSAKLIDSQISGTPSFCVSAHATPTLLSVTCSGANFDGADLKHATLANDFSSATFEGADLNGVDATGATWVACYPITISGEPQTCPGTNFTDAIWHRANLAGEDLSTAVFAGADLTNSNLAGASFGFVVPDIVTNPTDFHAANLTHVDFTGTDIQLADLSATDLDRAILTGTALVPSDQTVPATGPKGAVVTWPTPPAQSGATPGACTKPSGSTFRVGTTTVKCLVSDSTGHDAKGSFTVTVS